MIEIDPQLMLQINRLIKKFGELSEEMLDIACEAEGKYLLLQFRKSIPAYRHIYREEAYPPTGWQSERQRRYVMAAIRRGEIKIPYKRRSPKGGLVTQWFMEGKGQNLHLVNNAPHASLVYGEDQARLLQLAGWRRASQLLDGMEGKSTDAAARAITKLIKDKDL